MNETRRIYSILFPATIEVANSSPCQEGALARVQMAVVPANFHALLGASAPPFKNKETKNDHT